MEETIYRTMLLIFILLFFLIRAPNVLKYRKTKKTKSEKPGSDRFLVALNFVTMMGMPLIYIFTSCFDLINVNSGTDLLPKIIPTIPFQLMFTSFLFP